MKKSMITLLIVMFLSSVTAWSQDDVRPFFSVEFMKAAPGMAGDYVDMELEVYKKIHQKRVEKGQILGWYFYSIVSPSGTGVKADFVTVTVYPSAKSLDAPWSGVNEISNTIEWNARQKMLSSKTEELRDLVWAEIYRWIDGVQPREGSEPARYAAVNYMKVPSNGFGEWIDVETSYFKPFHQLTTNNKKRDGWGIYGKQFPWGDKYSYNAVAVDFYDSIEQRYADTGDEWVEVHGEDPGDSIYERTEKSRKMVKGELWHLISYVNAN